MQVIQMHCNLEANEEGTRSHVSLTHFTLTVYYVGFSHLSGSLFYPPFPQVYYGAYGGCQVPVVFFSNTYIHASLLFMW